MKFDKFIFFLLVFSFVCFEAQAQNPASAKQIRILNNYDAIPFEDGKTVIGDVSFTGLKLINEKEAFEVLKDNMAEIKSGDKFSGKKVSLAVKILHELFAANGYSEAEVAAFGEKVSDNEMKLNFVVKAGELVRVSEIRFEGNVNVSSEELIENFKQSVKDGWQIFDLRKYQYISRKYTLDLLFDKGYVQAKISEPQRQMIGDTYAVTFEINEGARYRIGKLKVEGATAFTEKEIVEMFGQKTGEVVSGKALQNLVYEKLKDIYADKGYITYDAEFDLNFVEPQDKSSDGIVNIEISIEEGKLFNLGKIEFEGVEKEEFAELRNLFSLADGEVYNRSKIEEGIRKINQTKKFYPLEFDSSTMEISSPIDTRRKDLTDEELSNRRELAVVIKLKKIE